MPDFRAVPLVQNICIIVLYTAGVFLAIRTMSGPVIAVWPPGGVVVASVILLGYRSFPALAVAILLSQWLVDPRSPMFHFYILIANMAAAWAALITWRHWMGQSKPDLNIRTALVGGAACLTYSLVCALPGSLAAAVEGIIPWAAFWNLWAKWELGDLTGAILCSPTLTHLGLLMESGQRISLPKRLWELLLWIGALVLSAWLAMWLGSHGPRYALALSFLPMALLMWSSVRFPVFYSIIGLMVVALFTLLLAGRGMGGFPRAQTGLEISIFLLFLNVLVISQYLIIVAAHQRRQHERQLLSMNRKLEEKVSDRTRELMQARDKLVLSEKMALLGNLTAGVAHEFNNPNNYISGARQNLAMMHGELYDLLIELAEKNAHLLTPILDKRFARLAEQLDHIQEGSLKISSVVRNLYRFTRLDEAARTRTDIMDGLRSTISLIKNQWDGIQFNLNLEENVECECWPAELNLVYLNLVMNACEAVTARRKIEGPSAPAVVDIRAERRGRHVEVRFKDTGIGIEDEHNEKIFEAFYTTRREEGAGGMGLYQVWQVVEKHGGHIHVCSNPGRGSEFTVVLPLA